MKRYISFVLVCVMLFTLLPFSASAASSMKASGKIMDYIKSKEGCVLTAYKLEGETYWTIGYGHYGPDVKADDKITQAEADAMFAQDLKVYEKAVNGYNDTYDLNLSQNEFDALVSFTYNCGTYWVTENTGWRISKYLKNDFKDANGKDIPDQEIADAFGVICNSGAGILPGLIKRRIEEAKIFLYSDYAGTGKHDFVYARFDPNGGTITNGNRVAIYTKGKPYGSFPEATKSSYYLSGWKSDTGYTYSGSTIAQGNRNLTAVWTKGKAPTKYTLTVNDGFGGGKYAEGASVRIAPLDKDGYSFKSWVTDDVSITENDGVYSFTMPAKSVTVTGQYEKKVSKYTLTVGNGSGGGKYASGTKVYISADTRSGYKFTGWSSDSVSVSYDKDKGSYYIIMPSKSVSVSAKYVAVYTLTVKNGSGSGKYEAGTKIYIGPDLKPGYCFTGWSVTGGSVTYDKSSGVYYIIMPKKSVTASATFKEGCLYGKYCPSSKFIDVDDNDLRHEGIDFCVENGLMTGTGADTFSPDDPMTRAMLITALYRHAGKPSMKSYSNPYTDVSTVDYYYSAAVWSGRKHINTDNGYGLFLPDEIMQRDEFALILYRYASKYLNYDIEKSPHADLSPYTDAGDISEGCREAVAWAIDKKILVGMTDSTIEPNIGVTRGQAASMLLRFMQACVSV